MRIHGIGLVLVLASALTRPAPGQQPASLAPGERVRVTWRDARGRLEGEVLTLLGDTLVVSGAPGAEATLVPLGRVRSLKVYRGRKSGADLGGAIGGGIGLLAGGLFGVATMPFSLEECPDDPEAIEHLPCDLKGLADIGWVVLTGFAVAVPTSLLGGLLGLPFRMDNWEQVPTDGLRFRVAPLPAGRVGAGVSLSF